jgi:NAD(P)-dependent dehydrogenase (short-subunit alcohol dehydrogenase family)
LSGKYIFITGGTTGIGRSTTLSFARAGAAGIAIGSRSGSATLEADIISSAKAVGKAPPKVLLVTLDVASSTSVEKAAKDTEAFFGRLDILINNAGYLSDFIPILEQDPDKWWTNWEVNIRGVYWMTRHFLPLLLKGGEKTIVNVSSIGSQVISRGASGYQGTKFALLRFTEHLMVDYAEEGLLAYCIHPAAVVTGLSSKMPEAIRGRKLLCFVTGRC